jgi:hypothetical protein
MFEKVNQAAEEMVTGISRRALLGKLGHGALALAGLCGAFLALPNSAHATRPGCCCCPDGSIYRGTNCPQGCRRCRCF